MKKTAIYADWDSVEIIKYKHTGYFKFARANSFAEAYKKKLWAGSPDTMTSCANYAT